MQNKSLLFVDRLDFYNQLLFENAKECGLNTIVLSPKPSKPYEYVDYFYQCENWNDDGEILKKIDEITKAHRVDGVTTFDEHSIQICAKICEKLRLPGITPQAANNARNKYLMRKAFVKHNVPSPRYQLIKQRSDLDSLTIEFPVVVKPVCGSGSMGVCKAINLDELKEYFDRVKAIAQSISYRNDDGEKEYSDYLLVEEYIEGREVCIEALTYKGDTNIVVIQDEPGKSGRYFAESTFTTPSTFPPEIQNAIREIAARAVKALGITTGPTHIELTIPDDMTPVVIEIGARVGGYGLFHNAVYYSRGIKYLKEIYKTRLDIEPDLKSRCDFVVGNVFLRAEPTRPSTIVRMLGLEEIRKLEGVKYVVLVAKPGDRVIPLPEGRAGGACGSVYVQTETHEENRAVLDEIGRLFKVELSDSSN